MAGEGLKVRSLGGAWPEILKAWGVNPVPVASSEQYMALQKGILEGTLTSWTAADQYKVYEVTKAAIETNVSCAVTGIIMNRNTWNSLPQDIQKTIEDLNTDWVGLITHGSEKDDVIGFELYDKKFRGKNVSTKG